MNKLALSLLAAGATMAMAQTSTTTTTTSTSYGTGTLTEYAPGSTFVVKESSGPVTYRYGKSVTYVTKSGKTISDADVKTRMRVGHPVRVEYDKDGDARVIKRVEVEDD